MKQSPTDEEVLAAAILAGARLRPQSFGSYFDAQGPSCVLGAAYEGVYLLPRPAASGVPRGMERLFHALEYVTRKCPLGCLKALPLASMLVHLNDDHHWTREEIAAWLTSGEGPSDRPDPTEHRQALGWPALREN